MIQTSAKTIILKNVMRSDLIWTDGDRVLNKHLHSCSLCVVVNRYMINLELSFDLCHT